MSEATWHYVDNAGQRQGPVAAGFMQAAFRDGRLRPESLVWRAGLAQWVSLHGVAFEMGLGAVPPPIPAPPAATRPLGSDPTMRMLLPVGRSPWAIAAGYLGLLAVTGIFAPFALVTGIIAVIDIKKHPDTHGMGRAIFGIVMGGAVTGLIAFLLL